MDRRYYVHVHTLIALDDGRAILEGMHGLDHGTRTPLACCGFSVDGETRCQAITAADRQCPKRAAVAYPVVEGHPVGVCGGHHDVHRRRQLKVVMWM